MKQKSGMEQKESVRFQNPMSEVNYAFSHADDVNHLRCRCHSLYDSNSERLGQ